MAKNKAQKFDSNKETEYQRRYTFIYPIATCDAIEAGLAAVGMSKILSFVKNHSVDGTGEATHGICSVALPQGKVEKIVLNIILNAVSPGESLPANWDTRKDAQKKLAMESKESALNGDGKTFRVMNNNKPDAWVDSDKVLKQAKIKNIDKPMPSVDKEIVADKEVTPEAIK